MHSIVHTLSVFIAAFWRTQVHLSASKRWDRLAGLACHLLVHLSDVGQEKCWVIGLRLVRNAEGITRITGHVLGVRDATKTFQEEKM